MIQQYVLNVVENCGNDMEYMVSFLDAVIIRVVNIRESERNIEARFEFYKNSLDYI